MGNRFQINIRPVWTPSEISTIGWYDASDLSTVSLGAPSTATQWNDKSGNSRNLSTITGTPNYGTATMNGLNVMWWDDTLAAMDSGILADINCSQVAIISVGMPKTPGDYPNFGHVGNTAVTDKIIVRLQCGATEGRISSNIVLDGVGTSLQSAYYSELKEEEPVIAATWYDGANAVSRTNGGSRSISANVADGATFTINRIGVGRDSNTPLNYHGEMVVLNTANIDTIELVEGYLAWKWGLVANLPVGHPYKLARPTA